MAINFGDILGGLGAAYGGRAQEYAEGIRQREQGLTEQKRVELEARQRAMYEDADTALRFLTENPEDPRITRQMRANSVIQLAEDRLDALSSYPDADPSDTLQILRDAQAMRDQDDPMAINRLMTTLFPAASIYRQRFAPQQQDETVVINGRLVNKRTGEVVFESPPETPQEPAAVQSLRIRATESGLIPGTPEYSDFMRSGGGGAGQVINVGGPSDKLNELVDAQLAGYMEQAAVSSAAAPQLQLLSQLAPLTTEGVIPATLSRMFPTINDANQAFIGVTNQVLPSLRVPGSGAQSDKDIDVLLNSIGPLSASSETKQLLIQSMMQKNNINQQLADVTQKVVDGTLTRPQATAEIRRINSQSIISPALQQALNKIIPSSGAAIPQSAIDAGVSPDEWSNMTPEQRGVFP